MEVILQMLFNKIAGSSNSKGLLDPELQKEVAEILVDAADGKLNNRTQIELMAKLNETLVKFNIAEEF